ncbi:MAG TPA: tripartite tricarboxylate transporter substrate binding protein [Lautropia sp.]|jgi:tripartite-type tricarboxylate transporter receptor subunit TctC|nr:tripartite tricarboxylate transporter substrate binding protein [Lautropia sp.]
MIDRRNFLGGAGAVALSAHLPARAQSFPSRAITLYCAFPAGGPTDQVFRAFGEAASRTLKQSVVVENKPGAGGTLAALAMRTARPDGYTLAQMPMGMFRIPHMQKTQTFDPIKDFTYVINLTGYTFGLVVPADSPIKSIKELVEYAKANPGQFTYGSTGVGTSPHLAVEEFASRAGIKLNHVPFKGNADLMQGIIGGHVMSASDSTGWAQYVESGRLRLLATYGSKRTNRWPDVPTLNELGYETVSDSPFGLGGPRDMDPQAVKVLHDAFRTATEDPGVLKMLERFDQSVVYMSPSEYTEWAKKTFEAERATIERLGMKGSL